MDQDIKAAEFESVWQLGPWTNDPAWFVLPHRSGWTTTVGGRTHGERAEADPGETALRPRQDQHHGRGDEGRVLRLEQSQLATGRCGAQRRGHGWTSSRDRGSSRRDRLDG